MVEFNYHECDFAMLFDGFCYMGWSNLNPGVKVSIENPYTRLIVKIDEQNLGSVIQKLCDHAACMTTEGTIRAKYEYRQGNLNITTEDTGEGLEKEFLPHVFERFSHDSRQRQCGSGLVLPIVKGLVELMGGTIEMASEPGKGTTVWISIPCELVSSEKKKDFI